MSSISEIEKNINEILSFNYANEVEEDGQNNENLRQLIENGVALGSPYAIKLKAVNDLDEWKAKGAGGDVPNEIIESLEKSAQYGFQSCMLILYCDDILDLDPIKRYAYLKLSKLPPGHGVYDLEDFRLSPEQVEIAEATYESMKSNIKKFYPDFECELLIGAEELNGEQDTV